ncbi:hypothetical protein L0F63_002678 [Massospora cicadina]|nr:hypothetical protein L0F63_002678 [Massospora cicadina]
MPASHSHERPSSPLPHVASRSKPDNMFGPYVLLYTIGEGEFAKVKYGIHSESGEEQAAIKLIRKDNVDVDKLSKIKREILVLKSLSHPYIVRLVEVIETQNYIGIVLEYASGGELFDHILAHRYLKEREACRLFAQLICGVDYLHRNKIIHRDLKLVSFYFAIAPQSLTNDPQENLLLDRNRNIIITDFGFANQFGRHGDDLMATSCGSPCYAAPELVVSDYAMLAGYLPFDDDPSNPEGDNINLLYKYILSTPLSFPDYVGSDARDLLRRMLVPDPAKRCKVKDIMNHRWMAPFKGLFEEFKLKAKLEFVTGTLSQAETEPKPGLESSSKTKRHTIQIGSSPENSLQKETLGSIKQECEASPCQPSNARPQRSPSLTSQRTAGSKDELAVVSSPTTESGEVMPLDPLALAHQPLDPFDPNTTVLFAMEGERSPERKAYRSRKDRSASSHVTFPSSTKQPKTRPISMQTPAPTKAKAPATDAVVADSRAKAGQLASSTPLRIDPNRALRPVSLDPRISQPSPAATLASDVAGVEVLCHSNRRDARKAFSAVLDASNGQISSQLPQRQSTMSPASTTARRITDWIKRKSIVVKSGTPPPGAPATEGANRHSLNFPRDSGAIYRLRYHRGAVDQFALTSRPPPVVIEEIKATLATMGFVLVKHHDYKIKIVRPLKGDMPRLPASGGRRFTFIGLRDLLQLRSRAGMQPSPRVVDPAPEPPAVPSSLYGDTSIDNGEEIRMAVELCRIKDFPNLYIFDIKRLKGNVWSYKFLYHLILEKLQLNANGGYLNPEAQPAP